MNDHSQTAAGRTSRRRLALGAVLLLVVPWAWPWRSFRGIRRAELARAAALPLDIGETRHSAAGFVQDMLARDVAYRCYVRPDDPDPLLTRRGERLRDRAAHAHRRAHGAGPARSADPSLRGR